MKWFKRIVIGGIVCFVIFFAFYHPEKINLGADDWEAKQIILEGKQIHPRLSDVYLKIPLPVSIRGWGNTITIPADKANIIAHLKFKSEHRGDYSARLSSKQKSLNGDFILKIDTVHIAPRSYNVELRIESGKTLLHLQRVVRIGEWRPPFPKKGGV